MNDIVDTMTRRSWLATGTSAAPTRVRKSPRRFMSEPQSRSKSARNPSGRLLAISLVQPSCYQADIRRFGGHECSPKQP